MVSLVGAMRNIRAQPLPLVPKMLSKMQLINFSTTPTKQINNAWAGAATVHERRLQPFQGRSPWLWIRRENADTKSMTINWTICGKLVACGLPVCCCGSPPSVHFQGQHLHLETVNAIGYRTHEVSVHNQLIVELWVTHNYDNREYVSSVFIEVLLIVNFFSQLSDSCM
jgi:hypothetical protein